MDIQTERAYQKQPTVFENRKAVYGKRKTAELRFTRAVGLGFKTPSEVCRTLVLTYQPSLAPHSSV